MPTNKMIVLALTFTSNPDYAKLMKITFNYI